MSFLYIQGILALQIDAKHKLEINGPPFPISFTPDLVILQSSFRYYILTTSNIVT